MTYDPQQVERLYNHICFRNDGCLEGLQVREFAKKLWSFWEMQASQEVLTVKFLKDVDRANCS